MTRLFESIEVYFLNNLFDRAYIFRFLLNASYAICMDANIEKQNVNVDDQLSATARQCLLAAAVVIVILCSVVLSQSRSQ